MPDVTGAAEVGTQIQVEEVVHLRSELRIRGRVAQPRGWVSLFNEELGFPWAEFVGPSGRS